MEGREGTMEASANLEALLAQHHHASGGPVMGAAATAPGTVAPHRGGGGTGDEYEVGWCAGIWGGCRRQHVVRASNPPSPNTQHSTNLSLPPLLHAGVRDEAGLQIPLCALRGLQGLPVRRRSVRKCLSPPHPLSLRTFSTSSRSSELTTHSTLPPFTFLSNSERLHGHNYTVGVRMQGVRVRCVVYVCMHVFSVTVWKARIKKDVYGLLPRSYSSQPPMMRVRPPPPSVIHLHHHPTPRPTPHHTARHTSGATTGT